MKQWLLLVPLALLLAACTSSISSTPPPANTPTSPPQPSGPHLLNTATLGGTQDAFAAAYGSPSGSGGEKTYIFTLSGIRGLVTVIPRGQTSRDGQDHVASLQIGPADNTTWDAAMATPICAHFTPPDARYVKTMIVPNSGPERVYVSAALASVFPAKDFQDGTTLKPDKPGTFAMQLGSGFPSNPGCVLILGS